MQVLVRGIPSKDRKKAQEEGKIGSEVILAVAFSRIWF
jgi:hypothetical protein